MKRNKTHAVINPKENKIGTSKNETNHIRRNSKNEISKREKV